MTDIVENKGSEKKEYLIENVNLISLTKWFNTFFGLKKSGEEFRVTDVQGYTRRGNVPAYLGGQIIETSSDIVQGVKSYSVRKSNDIFSV